MKKLLSVLFISSGIVLSGCATGTNPNDPYEAYNRQIFAANMAMDKYALRPITVGYTYVPDPIRGAISNFYTNLRDFVSLGNDILQLDGMNTMQTTMRIALNTTFGLLGLIDVASSLGLPEYKNTFGNTLKRWGWTDSSYFLVPFLGPGTVRDQLGIVPDVYFNPLFWVINDPWVSWSIFAVNLLDSRSKYLDQDQLLEQTLDPYATLRDLYLQKNGAYKYPTESADKRNDGAEEIDELIDESSTGKNNKSKANNDENIDAIIDDENAKIAASATVSK